MKKSYTRPKKIGSKEGLSDAMQSHHTSRPARFKAWKSLVQDGNEETEFFMFKARRTEVMYPCRTTTMVHKPISKPKAGDSPAARIAMSKDWDFTNASLPLVGRKHLKTPQIIHHSCVGVTLNILHSSHISATFFLLAKFDVFVLDTGDTLYVWSGKNVRRSKRSWPRASLNGASRCGTAPSKSPALQS